MPYNSPFTFLEFNRSLHMCNNSAPGCDNISYKMISKAHDSSKLLLLAIFNAIWLRGSYPSRWKYAIVLPFLKPGKPSDSVKSYRPISLTCSIGKLLEKMVNIRLMHTLERNNMLPVGQSGFRRMRGTLDSLTHFTSDILTSFRRGQYALCVSFDIEKAYDTTWRYHILLTLHRSNLPIFIQNFLSSRFFKTRIGSSYSSNYIQEQSVPQGSVISCTLFSLFFFSIAKNWLNKQESTMQSWLTYQFLSRIFCLAVSIKTRIGSSYSINYIQEQGVPQGSVIRP